MKPTAYNYWRNCQRARRVGIVLASALAIAAMLMIVLAMGGCQSLPVGGAGHPSTFQPQAHATQLATDQHILQFAGLALLTIGVLAFVFAFLLSSKLGDWIDILRNGGAAAAITGVILIAVATFIKAAVYTVAGIGAVCALALLCGGVAWLYFHRSDILPYLGKAKDQAVAGGGLVTASPTAGA